MVWCVSSHYLLLLVRYIVIHHVIVSVVAEYEPKPNDLAKYTE